MARAAAAPILAAVDSAPVDGDAVCHLDVRSDNLCFRDGRAILVDWNWTSLANPDLDVAAWLPSLRSRAGRSRGTCSPTPARLRRFIAGVWAAVVGLPPPRLRRPCATFSGAQLAVALDWIDRELF